MGLGQSLEPLWQQLIGFFLERPMSAAFDCLLYFCVGVRHVRRAQDNNLVVLYSYTHRAGFLLWVESQSVRLANTITMSQ